MPKEEILTGPGVIKLVSQYMGPEHVAFVEKACEYATAAHDGQFRKSGEPYIIHPIQVAGILADLKWTPTQWLLASCMMLLKIQKSP